MSVADDYTISFAQNREDIIIEGFFPDVEKGLYVDVGANDPEDDSVTKRFYEKGWRGINIEPSPGLFKKLVAQRPEDTNIQLGISSKAGKLKFREYANHGLSTFSQEMKKEYEKESDFKTASFQDYEVEVKPLSSVLDEIKPGQIHFMKVDVEGFEYEVLESNNWDKYRPEMICIEANHILKNWHPILEAAKYELVFDDGLNEYFLAKEALARKEFFDYPKTMILSKPIISPGLAKTLELIQDHNIVLERKLEHMEAELAQTVAQRNSLYVQLEQFNGLRSQLRTLAKGIYRKLLRTVEKLNEPSKPKKAIILTRPAANTSDKELMEVALLYDQSALKEDRILNNRLKRAWYLLCKSALKALVDLTKLGIRALSKTRRLLKRAA